MPASTFYPDAFHSIDLIAPNDNYGTQHDVGAYYLGGAGSGKTMLRRTFYVFDVYGPASEGRPLTPADTLTAADLLMQTSGLYGTTGFGCTVSRIDRAGYDPLLADWNTYDNVNAWSALGGDFGAPSLTITSPTIPLSPFTIANLLPLVTDAIASRGGLVRFAIYANNEAPGDTAFWAAADGTSPDRPRLRVAWQSADPTPIAEPLPGLAPRPAVANATTPPAKPPRGSRPDRPARPPSLRPRLA